VRFVTCLKEYIDNRPTSELESTDKQISFTSCTRCYRWRL